MYQSVLHDIYTQLKNKEALTPQDDKILVFTGTIKTLSWSHNSIN